MAVKRLKDRPADSRVLVLLTDGASNAGTMEPLQAAKLANADTFIRANPEGYHAKAGERGARFSGGEKQRISIARAITASIPRSST